MALNYDVVERDFNILNALFETVIGHMKDGSPFWEDFLMKSSKFQAQLKTTMHASNAFLDSFQKIADLATNSKGITKDVGSSLTRLCMRQRAIEAKMRHFTSAMLECLVEPLTDKLDEWKKKVFILEKEHNKDNKKFRCDLKKKCVESLHLYKKLSKRTVHQTAHFDSTTTSSSSSSASMRRSNDELANKYENSVQEVKDLCMLFEETEKQHLRFAMMQERDQFCDLFTCVKPMLEHELAMLDEATHLADVVQSLCKSTSEPYALPHLTSLKIEQILSDNVKAIHPSEYASFHKTLSDKNFASPLSHSSSPDSRKSSVCSLTSYSSAESSNSNSLDNFNVDSSLRYMKLNEIAFGKMVNGGGGLKASQGDGAGDEVRHTLAGLPHHPHHAKTRSAITFHTYEPRDADKLSLQLEFEPLKAPGACDATRSQSMRYAAGSNQSSMASLSDARQLAAHEIFGASPQRNQLTPNRIRSSTLPIGVLSEGLKEFAASHHGTTTNETVIMRHLQSPAKRVSQSSFSDALIEETSPGSASGSFSSKPLPPVRRNSSITTTVPSSSQIYGTTRTLPNGNGNKLASIYGAENEYAELPSLIAATARQQLLKEENRMARQKLFDKIDELSRCNEAPDPLDNLPPPPESFFLDDS